MLVLVICFLFTLSGLLSQINEYIRLFRLVINSLFGDGMEVKI